MSFDLKKCTPFLASVAEMYANFKCLFSRPEISLVISNKVVLKKLTNSEQKLCSRYVITGFHLKKYTLAALTEDYEHFKFLTFKPDILILK